MSTDYNKTMIRPGKCLLFGPRFDPRTVKMATRLAHASKMARAEAAPAEHPVVSVYFNAFLNAGYNTLFLDSIEQAQKNFALSPELAGAIFDHTNT